MLTITPKERDRLMTIISMNVENFQGIERTQLYIKKREEV